MHGTIQRLKLKPGEVKIDLGEFLPADRTYWRSSEVDAIVDVLKGSFPEGEVTIANEVWRRSHVDYQVLHVRVRANGSKLHLRLCAEKAAAAVLRANAVALKGATLMSA